MSEDISIEDSYDLKDGSIVYESKIKTETTPRSHQYTLRVSDMPSQMRPREKMLKHGASTLNLNEVIAVILGFGTRKEELFSMSNRILKEYGDKTLINTSNPKIISESIGIPIYKACQIVAALELGRRFYFRKSGKPMYIRNANQAYEYLKTMANLQKEQLKGLYLNSRYELIREEVISVGSLTSSIVHPREVFRPAIDSGAVGIIIAHNHPSNNSLPTEADIMITTQIEAAGTILGIDLLDHLIINENGFKSIME